MTAKRSLGGGDGRVHLESQLNKRKTGDRGAGCTIEKGTWKQEVSADSHLTKELYCC